ncbi:hypothetical protein J2Z62_000819 [Mycoplasmoides fastidiosum]|uniref:Uncharacterized protein n=1 Tax=Mycoplasmoides fastidiosum TaxID=92758 RepID=A0ABU0M0A9_9BACT|nr:hypothetical protein [Mycoplasmoides fastidiosum]MDQ0514381.1 hypothetical protein [Mycoplasmoides fastidiosum]UUD38021.1 hypothetical protein NPA10_01340 [Mycoplasmoides fastidiosum]
MNSKFKKNLLSFTDKYWFSLSANWLISFAILTSSALAFVSSTHLIHQKYQAQKAAEQIDPVQDQLARITQSGVTNSVGGGDIYC